ncbi:MAG: glycosyltransferase [Candidatus Micrarchaeota archaeon]
MISIVIPAFNEEKRILPTLEGLASFFGKKDFEIIVVFDGRDDTPGVVRKFASERGLQKKVRVLQFKRRLGKGAAVLKGFACVKGTEVLMLDADSSVSPNEIPKLLSALKTSDIAIGSRYLRGSKTAISFARFLFAMVFHQVVRLLFSLPFKDTQCGFKAFRTGVAKKLSGRIKTNGFAWDVDMLVQARDLNLRVKEIPITWRLDDGGSITYANGLQTALKMFFALLKLRFSDG